MTEKTNRMIANKNHTLFFQCDHVLNCRKEVQLQVLSFKQMMIIHKLIFVYLKELRQKLYSKLMKRTDNMQFLK